MKNSPRSYFIIWILLMLLLLLTWGLAQFDLGSANVAAALLIALIKMTLVMLFFMHLRLNSKITWVFAGAGFVWFLIMVSLTMTDFLTRGLVRPENKTISYWQDGTSADQPGKEPEAPFSGKPQMAHPTEKDKKSPHAQGAP